MGALLRKFRNSFFGGLLVAFSAVTALAYIDPSKLPSPEYKQVIVGGGALVWGTVNNNTDLSALSTTYIKSVTRLGYAVAGDGPAVDYLPSASACTLSAGAGDGGSQVPSSNGKCWLAQIPETVSSAVWGATGTGVGFDDAKIAAGLAYLNSRGGGELLLGQYHNVTAPIALSYSNVSIGCIRGIACSLYTTATNQPAITVTAFRNRVRGLIITFLNTPVDGATGVLWTGSTDGIMEDVNVGNSWNGAEFTGGASNIYVERFNASLYRASGLYLHDNTLSVKVNGCILVANSEAGHPDYGRFGGIRLKNQVEAALFSQCDVYWGKYGLVAEADANVQQQRPAYIKFEQTYFDSNDQGNLINVLVQTDFVDCWFSGGRVSPGYPSLSIFGGEQLSFTSTTFNWSGTYGVYVNSTTKFLSFVGINASNNSGIASNTYDGMYFVEGTSDFSISGSTFTNSGFNGVIPAPSQAYGVRIATGASDRYSIIGNKVFGNGAGGISDGGTGSNKLLTGNF